MNRRFAALGMLASVLLAPAVAAPMIPIAGDPVRTASGLVAGTRLDSGVRAYLGIPYARPPVDELRWQRPQPYRWQGVWNADRTGPECIQFLRRRDINHYFGQEASSEDCLTLNIWTPATAAPGAKLPVIVFIYGGGGTIGSAGMAHYDGENFARHGAIMVNLNYRVGIMGFMAHPELSKEQDGHSGNYGYLDQNAALKWVHANIAAFGGDPAQVVIAGQSAGASSVAEQIMSPLSKGLFRGAMMSSSCNFTRNGVPLAEGEKVGLDIQKRLGVRSLAEMRNVASDKILAVQSESQNLTINAGVTLPRVMDGYFWPKTKLDALQSNNGSAVPVIAGFNGDDNDMLPDRFPLTSARTVAGYQDIARKMYGADADAFLKLFPVQSDADVAAVSRQAASESAHGGNGGYIANSRACGELQAKYNRQPTYVNLFVRKHPYIPGVVLADQNTATVGAYHNADIPYWFGTLEAFNMMRRTRDWTPADWKLSGQMTQALIAFARTGSPNTADVNWPAWTAAKPQYLVWNTGSLGSRTMNLKRMDWLAAHSPAPVTLAPRQELRARD